MKVKVMTIKPAVVPVPDEVGELFVHSVDTFNHQVEGRRLLCLPRLGGQLEWLENSDGALQQLPF